MKKQEFVEKRAELSADFGAHDRAIIHRFLTPTDNTIPLAYDLLKKGTREFYEACEMQYTLPIDTHMTNDIRDILNEKGLALYNDVLEKVNRKEFKDTYSKYFVDSYNSGMWHANKDSPFFDQAENVVCCLNTFRNRKIQGLNQRVNKVFTTSCCIFYKDSTDDDGWCYTASGSLYRLQEKIGFKEMQDLLSNQQ